IRLFRCLVRIMRSDGVERAGVQLAGRSAVIGEFENRAAALISGPLRAGLTVWIAGLGEGDPIIAELTRGGIVRRGGLCVRRGQRMEQEGGMGRGGRAILRGAFALRHIAEIVEIDRLRARAGYIRDVARRLHEGEIASETLVPIRAVSGLDCVLVGAEAA